MPPADVDDPDAQTSVMARLTQTKAKLGPTSMMTRTRRVAGDQEKDHEPWRPRVAPTAVREQAPRRAVRPRRWPAHHPSGPLPAATPVSSVDCGGAIAQQSVDGGQHVDDGEQ